jgi:hypothetical protein
MRNPILRRPLVPETAPRRVSLANWTMRILIPHAVIQAAILFSLVGERNDLLAYFPAPPILYYAVFTQSLLSAARRTRFAERLSTLLLSIWVASATWLAAFVLCLPLVAFTIGTVLMLFFVPPSLREIISVVLIIAVFAAGGAFFGYGTHLGLHGSDEGRWRDIRFRAHILGGAIGAALVGTVVLVALDRDLGPTSPERWLWRSVVVLGALPHMLLTWRAYNRGTQERPAVSQLAGT